MRSPHLLVTCEDEENSRNYLAALAAVGCDTTRVTLVLPNGSSDRTTLRTEIAALARAADGVLLCGGPDVLPEHYGETAQPDAGLEVMPELDAIDFGALDGARAASRPVLAICRGLQVANVWAGGSLWQDLPSQAPSAVTHRIARPKDALAHPVTALAGVHRDAERGALPTAEVATFVGWFGAHADPTASLPVNSRHHQAIRNLAPGLFPLATSPDGLIEAMAGRWPGWWLWAVQWHPENLLALPAQHALFTQFRDAALGGATQPDAAGHSRMAEATP